MTRRTRHNKTPPLSASHRLPEVTVALIVEHLGALQEIVAATATCTLWQTHRRQQVVRWARASGLAVELVSGRGSAVRKVAQLRRARAEFENVHWESQRESEAARRRFVKYPLNVVAIYAAPCVQGFAGMCFHSFHAVVWLGFDALIRTVPATELARRAETLAPALLRLLDRVVASRHASTVPTKTHAFAVDVASVLPKFPAAVLAAHSSVVVSLLLPLYSMDAGVHANVVRPVLGGPLALFHLHKAVAKIPTATLVRHKRELLLHYGLLVDGRGTGTLCAGLCAGLGADAFFAAVDKAFGRDVIARRDDILLRGVGLPSSYH